MSWTISGLGRSPVLFQVAGTPSAAYSLRQLDLADKAVVRVRRSSDNTEQDFTATQVADGTLASFCATGDGFVRTLYDQTGNGQHAAQTVQSQQPKIVSNGSVVLLNGKPAISFDGINDGLATGNIGFTSQDLYCFTVFSFVSATGVKNVVTADDGIIRVAQFARVNLQAFETVTFTPAGTATADATTGSANTDTQLLHTSARSGAAVEAIKNGAGNGSTALPGANFVGNAPITIGYRTLNYAQINLQEVIVYANAAPSGARAAIESNINAHYVIY